MVRRSGVDDVIAPWEFEELFKTAASIRDLDLAIEMAYLLYAPGRLGPRNSEALHVSRDYYVTNESGDIVAYRIPSAAPDCNCNICQRLAKRRADDDDDPDATAGDYLDEYWQPKSHAGGRTIPVIQNRGQEILEMYGIEHIDRPNMTGQTYRNRLARLEELCHAVDVNLYPQSLRATCTNYWALWGLNAKELRWMFGWKYISTAQYYIRKSDVALRWKMEEALGREPSIPYEIYNEPPTFLDLRPDNTEDLIEVGNVTPKSAISAPSTTGGSDPLEEYAQTELKNTELSDFYAGVDPISPLVRERLTKEHKAAVDSDEVEYPLPPARAAALCTGLLGMAVVMGIIWGATGALAIDPINQEFHATPEATMGLLLGMGRILFDIPDL